MNILIVEENQNLAHLWTAALYRLGAHVHHARSISTAIHAICETAFDVIILDLICQDTGTMTVADFAAYRSPNARVIFVTNTRFFSDGSIFDLCQNTAGFVPSHTPPEDLAALVQHHAAEVPTLSRSCGAQ